jgi:hypothetical protein
MRLQKGCCPIHPFLEIKPSMPATQRFVPLLPAAIFIAAVAPQAAAQDLSAGRYYELETKYLFGFTAGADIGLEGENEVESETTAALGLRRGAFSAVEQEFEYENVPTQFWNNEFSLHTLWNQIDNVEGLDNRNSLNFSGFSWKSRFLIIPRGPGNPFGLMVWVQPEWGRIDGTSGASATTFAMNTGLAVDTEIIPNMFYAAANLLYDPEISSGPGDLAWSRAAGFGATAAIAYRVTPKVTLGGEAQYYRDYEGFGFNALSGSAFYVGPTVHVQFNPKVFLAAAWSVQVAGHAGGEPGNLDLTNFTRQLASLKFGYEF